MPRKKGFFGSRKNETDEEYEIEGGKKSFHSTGFWKCANCNHPITLHILMVGKCIVKDCDCRKFNE